MLRPRRLRRGDVAAIVSPSWGGPAAYPATFEAGLEVLRAELGLRVVEMPHVRAAAASPRERAADLNAAFADPDVRMVIASIGGEDSIRVLPFLDPAPLLADPKVVMGYSDTTTLLVWMAQRGLVSFHGPSVMAGFAQARAFPPAFLEHVRAMLFDGWASYEPYGSFTDRYEDWGDPANAARIAPLRPDGPPRRVLGSGRARGTLLGGCIEVLEFLRGTPYLPLDASFDGRVWFFETSEEAPPPSWVRRVLRTYGAAGIFDRIAALLVGRPKGYTDAEKLELDVVLAEVIGDELGRRELPVLSNLDFGHTDPQWLLPLGCDVEVDTDACTLRLLAPALTVR